MDHTVTTLHVITKQCANSRTIIKEKVKKIMIKNKYNRTQESRSLGNKEKGQDSVIWTRYGRIVQKTDRLAY